MPPHADRPGDLQSVEVFSSLGDENRLAIVGALHEHDDATPMSFSTLYDHVDVDDTGRFNYHLSQLVPHFVAKREEGYGLTGAGRRLARAVAAGTFTDVPRLEPFAIDGRCYACDDDALEASYDDEAFAIRCRHCDELILDVHVPPTVVRGRSPSEVVDAFERWSKLQVDQARHGICPDCGGAVESAVATDVASEIEFDAAPTFTCSVCGRRAVTSVGALAARHPAVREFHDERGESLDDRRYWEIDQYVAGQHVEVRSRDPWLFCVSFHAAGDACHVEIDGTLEVVRVEIAAGEAPGDV